MPYQILKIAPRQYYVVKANDHSKRFSIRPHRTKRDAIKQMQAIAINEHGGNVEGGFVPFLGLAKTAYDLIPIRKEYSPAVKQVMNQYGNNQIVRITIYRKPIQQFVNTALNISSMNKWGRAVKDYGYDKVFHLYMIATLNNGVNILIEKNEIINIKVADQTDILQENGSFMQVTDPPVPNWLILNQMMQNTRAKMGEEMFWRYDAFLNNCQVFIKYILDANGMINQRLLDFIDQNIESIARQSLSAPAQGFAKFTTNLASKLRTLQYLGRGLF